MIETAGPADINPLKAIPVTKNDTDATWLHPTKVANVRNMAGMRSPGKGKINVLNKIIDER